MPTKKELESLQSKLKEQNDRIYFLERRIAYLKDLLNKYKIVYGIQGFKHLTDSDSDTSEYNYDTE